MDNIMLLGSNKKIKLYQHSNNLLEIRWYNQSENSSYYAWKITKQEVEDLLHWWMHSGVSLNSEQLKISNFRYRNISISIHTLKSISIRGIDNYGKLKQIGASFPIELIENLEMIMCPSSRGD